MLEKYKSTTEQDSPILESAEKKREEDKCIARTQRSQLRLGHPLQKEQVRSSSSSSAHLTSDGESCRSSAQDSAAATGLMAGDLASASGTSWSEETRQ